MKQFAVAALLVLSLMLIGCGSNNSMPSNINGTWNASLMSTGGGPAVLAFGMGLKVNGDGSLVISNFSFNTSSPCFVSGETESGSFTLSGNFNGQVNGTFGFNVLSGNPAGNTLTLSGTASGNTISGTWTLAGGTGCSGSGTFTMTKM
jgi:hypothetical protein